MRKIVLSFLLLTALFLFAGNQLEIKELSGSLVKAAEGWKITSGENEILVYFGQDEQLANKNIELKEVDKISVKYAVIDNKNTVISYMIGEDKILLRDAEGNWIETKKGGYKVDATNCIGCNLCPRSCPVNAITMVKGKAVIDSEKCIDCGLCVDSCPVGAISK
jgi:ferredoxin